MIFPIWARSLDLKIVRLLLTRFFFLEHSGYFDDPPFYLKLIFLHQSRRQPAGDLILGLCYEPSYPIVDPLSITASVATVVDAATKIVG